MSRRKHPRPRPRRLTGAAQQAEALPAVPLIAKSPAQQAEAVSAAPIIAERPARPPLIFRLRRVSRLYPWLLLFLAYALLRLWNLERLVMNGDEAIYIYRGLTRESAAYLGEGKYLTLWLYSLIMPLVWNPLWAARFLSVVAGAVTLWAVYGISREPENRPAGVLPAIFLVLCPFTVFFDRVVMADTFLTMSGALVLFSAWRLANTAAWWQAVWLGLSLALGLLIKIPAVLFLPLPCWVLLFFRKRPLTSYLGKLAVAYAVPAAVMLLLFINGGWGAQLGRYVTGIKVQGVSPEARPVLTAARVNLSSIHDWMVIFLTQPFFYVAVGGLLLVLVLRRRFGLFWLAVAATFLLPFTFGAQLLFPHYVLFGTVPLYFCAGAAVRTLAPWLLWPFRRAGWASSAARLTAVLILAGLAYPMVRYDFGLISRPEKLKFPWPVEVGFVTEWPGGYGGPEVYAYLDASARRAHTQIRVLRFGVSVGVARLLQVYGFGSRRMALQDVDLTQSADLELLRKWGAAQPTFVVMDDPPFFGDRKIDLQPVLSLLQPVFRVEKPGGIRAIVVYRYAEPGAATQSLVLSGFAGSKVVSDPAYPADKRVELVEREVQGLLQPVVLTVAPVDLWLPMVETAGPSVLSLLLEVSDTTAGGLEAGVDFACAHNRQPGFREYFNPGLNPADRGWHKRSLLLPRNMLPGCWVVLRALRPEPAQATGGRVSWAKVSVQPLPRP